MSKEKRRVPKLRFPGFTEDWEQRKLVDLFEYLQNNTLSRDSLNYKFPNIKNIHYGDILVKFDEILNGDNSDIPFINRDIDLSKYSKSLLTDGDIIFSDTAEDDSVGKAIELQNVNEPFMLSGLHTIPCRTLIPFGKGYLGNFLNSDAYRIQLKPLVQGIKVSSISKSALKDTIIKYPNKLEEQEKIGTLFSEITALITLHQRKLDNLKLKKKALLQKLFPKNGERYPELRFPGFTDAWEQRKLGDVAIITGGGTPSTNVPEYWNGDIDWYSPVEIGENRYVSKSIRKITKLGLEKSSAKLLPIGTVLFTSRAGIGNTAILQAEGCTNQGFQSITPDSKELDTYFLYTMTPRLKRYGEVTGAGSTFVEVSGKQMEKMSLVLPSLEEQKQIGRFFRTIDDSITLHQRKLDHLQLQKKALLQQMFV